MTDPINLEEMTSPDIKTAIKSGMKTVVFAVGSNEQHGPCLPVSTDSILGEELAYLVAQKLGNTFKGPTINIGCSDHHMKFASTISLRKETLQSIIRDYCASLIQHGFQRIIIVPTHGGNFNPITEIMDDLKKEHSTIQILAFTDLQDTIKIGHKLSAKFGVSKEEAGVHAGESEVSRILWARGELVKTERIPEATGYLGELSEQVRAKLFQYGIGALSPIGVLGSPAKASAEHGKYYMEEKADNLVKQILNTE